MGLDLAHGMPRVRMGGRHPRQQDEDRGKFHGRRRAMAAATFAGMSRTGTASGIKAGKGA
jgi:hypothetical protein